MQLTPHQQQQYTRLISLRDQVALAYHAYMSSKQVSCPKLARDLAMKRTAFAVLTTEIFGDLQKALNNPQQEETQNDDQFRLL